MWAPYPPASTEISANASGIAENSKPVFITSVIAAPSSVYATSSDLLPRTEILPLVIFTPGCRSKTPTTLLEAELRISWSPMLRTELVALFSMSLFSPIIVIASPSTADVCIEKLSGVVRSTLTDTLDSILL